MVVEEKLRPAGRVRLLQVDAGKVDEEAPRGSRVVGRAQGRPVGLRLVAARDRAAHR